MKKYVEYERDMILLVKMGLQSQMSAIDRCSAYLRAMADFNIISEDRLSEELRITTKKILEIWNCLES